MGLLRCLWGALFALCFAIPATAAELPRIVSKDGRHALLVDGAPYLILGGQAHNSSNYPDMLPEVWPTIKALHANTLEIPVAWEPRSPSRSTKAGSGVSRVSSKMAGLLLRSQPNTVTTIYGYDRNRISKNTFLRRTFPSRIASRPSFMRERAEAVARAP